VNHGQDNQEHNPYGDGRRCSLCGNDFRAPVASSFHGHCLQQFLHQESALQQRFLHVLHFFRRKARYVPVGGSQAGKIALEANASAFAVLCLKGERSWVRKPKQHSLLPL
jgi:hypothetical protein